MSMCYPMLVTFMIATAKHMFLIIFTSTTRDQTSGWVENTNLVNGLISAQSSSDLTSHFWCFTVSSPPHQIREEQRVCFIACFVMDFYLSLDPVEKLLYTLWPLPGFFGCVPAVCNVNGGPWCQWSKHSRTVFGCWDVSFICWLWKGNAQKTQFSRQ